MNVPVPDEYIRDFMQSALWSQSHNHVSFYCLFANTELFYSNFYLMFLLDWIATFISLYPNPLLLENKNKGIKDLATQKLLSVVTLSNYPIIYNIEVYQVNSLRSHVSYISVHAYQNVFHLNCVFITPHSDKKKIFFFSIVTMTQVPAQKAQPTGWNTGTSGPNGERAVQTCARMRREEWSCDRTVRVGGGHRCSKVDIG